MKITTVGIDLAKNVFQVHGIDGRGKGVLRKQLRRAQVAVFFGNLQRCGRQAAYPRPWAAGIVLPSRRQRCEVQRTRGIGCIAGLGNPMRGVASALRA
jgi:transposase